MPTYSTLINRHALEALLREGPAPAVFDCSFDLADPEKGEIAYAQGHLPSAQYLHLGRDLSGPKTGHNGRHPLPDREVLAARLRELGLQRGQQVVVYDAQGGMFAARAWWLLRWLGHSAVAVLDGGLPAWQAAGLALPSTPTPGDFVSAEALVASIDRVALLESVRHQGPWVIVDARAADRFRGENETLDARGGHIPGARNRFFRGNLAEDGLFKPAAVLRDEFKALLGDTDARQSVQQCGSGVTACHNLLALEIAGMRGASLYPGSWSEWSSDPDAPIETAL
ncbi:putative 3-mercaptopyruvate sulfurtransferase [Pseudomonas reidholzensis]|uniref:Sulfurtransferase n=1 Tax=Pseudomonas reidholzensis TaxID=1785162 RepID=A0A383RXM1_9PSED|nr:sulfurtransferase [Pseudomonas reidholzensis]SYX91837.1 putative 3-mercaptopyruvate sulfurtransferase [Pseudomonas reidholzensis]